MIDHRTAQAARHDVAHFACRSVVDMPKVASRRRPAFTMIELMVSIAVLVGVMTMVATIFATASKAGGQAIASATVYRYQRQVTDILRSDLQGVEPLDHILAIAGVEVEAEDTPTSKTSSQHRADVLMMFTDRNLKPYVYEGLGTADTVQVVYGHADIGKLNTSGTAYGTDIKYIEGEDGTGPSDIPASQWHLARRVIAFPEVLSGSSPDGADYWPPTNSTFLDGSADLIWETLSDVEANRIPKGLFKYSGGSVQYLYEAFPAGFGTYCRYDADTSTWLLDYGGYWFKHTGGIWEREEWGSGTIPFGVALPLAALNGLLGGRQGLVALDLWFYDPTQTNRRTLLDPAPPVTVGDARLGSYFLPGCSDFIVEYTYDDPREIMIDSTNGAIIDIDGDNLPDPQPIRWYTVPNGQQIIWSRLSATVDYTDDPTDPHRWPRALRITIRVYDQGGRLDSPIEQTLIHVW